VQETEYGIGEVAIRAGVSVDAVRYYERLELSPRARTHVRRLSRLRCELVQQVQFIKQAQELGLMLDDIKALLATDGAEECIREFLICLMRSCMSSMRVCVP